MQQEQGCGWGCGLVVLVLAVFTLSVLVPFVGLPLGLLLALVAVILALLRRGEERDR